MPQGQSQYTHRRIKLLVGLILAGILYLQYELSGENEVVLSSRAPVVLAAERMDADPFERMIRTRPLDALIAARERHIRLVEDYTCTLVKQEMLPSGMSEEQEIDVLFRQQPYSVVLHWRRNAGLAERVVYVKDRWIDPDPDSPEERDLAVCQPGAVARLLVKSLKQPIRSALARRTSRRSVDEFGFTRALDLLIKYCQIAKESGELKLDFCGESRFDGRPVWVVRRHLPYTDANGLYPDRLAEIFFDKEYRVPVAVYCYSDDNKSSATLLGKYEYRNIRLHAGLRDADFDPATYGM